jgi:hypothetical protein
LLTEFRRRGIGAVCVRGRLHLRRLSPWFYDNGAFEDWRAERPFDEDGFRRDLASIELANVDPPDFIVAPDRVGEGASSLAESVSWLPDLRAHRWPVYLAVQDGMETLELGLERFDGVFIGGTLPWKLRTAPHWAAEGRRVGLPVHFARCGNARRVAYARALGCASLDSSLPLWSRAKLGHFTQALDQLELISEFPRDAVDAETDAMSVLDFCAWLERQAWRPRAVILDRDMKPDDVSLRRAAGELHAGAVAFDTLVQIFDGVTARAPVLP